MTAAFLSLLADHALLVCIGLLAAAVLAWPARALLKRDPQSCYQLLLALLVGAVAVLPIQLLVQGRAAPLAAPAREWLRSLTRPALDRQGTPDLLQKSGPQLRDVPFETFLVDQAPVERVPPAQARDVTTAASTGSAVPAACESNDEPSCAAATLAGAQPAAAPTLLARAATRANEWKRAVARFARSTDFGRAAVGLWLLGVAFIALRRLLRAVRTVRMVAQAQPVADPAVLALWRRVGGASSIAKRVRLVASDAVESPACTGLFRRVLILPARPARPLASDILEWALRHELVHLERGDHWAALFQSSVTALLWFHPAAWWLSAEIGRLRELSCDQRVVEASGRRKSYALALLECAASLSRSITTNPITAIDADPHSAGVRCALLHWSRSPTQIRRRIEMLTVESQSLPRTRKVLGILLATCALAVPAIAQVAGAATLLPARQDAPKLATPPAPPATPAPPAVLPATNDDGSLPPPAPKRKKRQVVAPVAAPAPIVESGTPAPLALPCDPSLPAPALAPCPPAGADCCNAVACDDGDNEQYAAALRAQVRTAQRQVELALKQAQRTQATEQSTTRHQLDQLRKQEERARFQSEKRRSAIDDRLAETEEESKRDMLQKQLAEIEAASSVQTAECEKRCADLEANLAEIEAVDFDDCFESVGDFQQTMENEVEELNQQIAAAASQAAQSADGSDDRDLERAAQALKVAADRYAKQAKAHSDQARARVAETLARSRQGGAVSPATPRQIDEALARAGQVDTAELHRTIERAVVSAQRAAQNRKRTANASSGVGASAGSTTSRASNDPSPRAQAGDDPSPRATEELAVRAARAGANARPRTAPRLPEGATGDAAAPTEVTEERLLERITALQAELESLRADLARLHGAPPTPAGSPAKRVRAMH